jgi:DNA-binding IscR family transcriptional regulator
MYRLSFLQQEIIKELTRSSACYRSPISSFELARVLNVPPAYIRRNITKLKQAKMVGVRRGLRGGFFLI